VALNLQQGHEPGTSNSDERTRKIWKRVWLLSITPKVGHFLFKCLHNSLATRELDTFYLNACIIRWLQERICSDAV